MTLNEKLIKHYECFQTERFYLDEHNKENGFLSIVSSSISDTCPYKLCKNIAKFCKKHIDHEKYKFIYIACWVFEPNKI